MRTLEEKVIGSGGDPIQRRAWLPDTESPDAVVIAHGFAEHSGRYAHVAEALVKRGFAVASLDHEGHGRSGGPRVNVRRFQNYIDDLDALVSSVKGHQPGALFLLGHSLGGLIAAEYAVQHQDRLSGLVLSGPSVMPVPVSPVLNLLARTLARLAPGTGVVELPLDAVSRDPLIVAAYLADPLVQVRRMPARQAVEAVDAQRRLASRLGSIRLPLLVLQGTADKLVDPASAPYFIERVGSTDKTLKLYEGLYHEVFNEPEKEQVIADLISWLEARRPRPVEA